ncbi:MAG TPA: branched-chain amino acid ABC transporter permease [Acetobacteraceae bacterium]|nr:branched-chain amino acid ABC transporter permease [Acetobacteraceae bacterium]
MAHSSAASLIAAALLILLAALLPAALAPYGVYLLSLWAVYTIAAIGLNLTLGYAGQMSLAHAAFVGIGAYATALLGAHGVPFPVTLLAATLLAFGVGWCVGYPALRVQGHYLAFVTLAFTTLVFLVLRNEAWLTGGIGGISNIARPRAFSGAVAYLRLCLAALLAVSLATWWLLRSPWGRAFIALRENPVRAMSLGVDVRRYTLLAFAIGAAIGGIAGAFYAPLVQYIEPSPFALGFSINLLMMVVIGGAGYFLGPFLGALVAVLLPEWLRVLQNEYLIVYALAVILLLLFCPTGLLGLAERLLGRGAARAADDAPATS